MNIPILHPFADRMHRYVHVRALVITVLVSIAAAGCGSPEPSPPRPGEAFPAVTADGAWCWFADPRAVYDTVAEKTYVGWVDSTAGTVSILSHDHHTGEQVTAPVANLHRDDHANPALLIRPDGRVMTFYSAHNGPELYYRKTQRPQDLSAWGSAQTIDVNTEGDNGYTYPNPIQLSAENDRIYLFWRGGNWQPNFSVSARGEEWTPARTLLRVPGERPYIKYVSNGVDRFDFAFTDGHPRRMEHNNIYYARYRDGGFHRADGGHISSIDSLPLEISATDRVYDAEANEARAWIWDTAIDSSGYPVIVFSVLPTEEDHRYRYARWTPRGWKHYEIAEAGSSIDGPSEPHYSGGVVLDHEQPSTVYLSRDVDGTHELEQWTTTDGGRTWKQQAITGQSAAKNVRPVAVRHRLSGDWQVLWMYGAYQHYTDYQTSIKHYP
jgi:hypothetical protein